MARTEELRTEAARHLRKMLRPGATVYTTVIQVSRNGAYRHIKLTVPRKGEIVNISGYAADLLGWRWHDDGTVGVGGSGMDMGFHTVYEAAAALFPKGFSCIGDRCPSNDHSNGDRDYTPHKHKSGGYALRQQWI